jgi:hypothetical protein
VRQELGSASTHSPSTDHQHALPYATSKLRQATVPRPFSEIILRTALVHGSSVVLEAGSTGLSSTSISRPTRGPVGGLLSARNRHCIGRAGERCPAAKLHPLYGGPLSPVCSNCAQADLEAINQPGWQIVRGYVFSKLFGRVEQYDTAEAFVTR